MKNFNMLTGKNAKRFMSVMAGVLALSMAVAPVQAYVDDTNVEEAAFTSSVDEKSAVEEDEEVKSFTSKIKKEVKEEKEKEEKEEKASTWDGPVLNSWVGTVEGPSGKETYYNLDMSGVIQIMRSLGNTDEYWVREDGCKMLGDYIMCAANLDVHPRGSLVESSLGTCIVCDTGGFAAYNPTQLDIATTW